ncbi:ABC transporter permease [Agromyces sp. NPDC060279]|uniref:ABC transporter permease n=1 Tax=Agromyces sp. NPDC060279 TaxID=3347092 RepID=UPI00364DE682
MPATVSILVAPTRFGRGRRGPARTILLTVAQGVLTLFLVSLLIFVVTQAMPGDVAAVILGSDATPESLAALRAQLGLDRPLWEQYLSWLLGVLHGDFGVSLANREAVPVAELIAPRLSNSVALAGVSLVVMLPLAVVIGVVAARFRDSLFDRAFLAVSMVVNATPEFVIGMVLITLLGTTVFPVLPPVALIPPGASPLAYPAEITLPVIAVVLSGIAYLGRLVRVSFIDVLDSEYVQTATLKGLSEARILFRHALPNALPPVVPAATLVAASVVGGVVVVEYLFGFNGLGGALVSAVNTRNLPVIQAIVLIIATAYFTLNLVADALTARLHRTR